jgi:hypothetical protein
VKLWNCELFSGFEDREQQRTQKRFNERRTLRMEDKSNLNTFEFALECLNLTPRGVFDKENPSGEANNNQGIEHGGEVRLRSL